MRRDSHFAASSDRAPPNKAMDPARGSRRPRLIARLDWRDTRYLSTSTMGTLRMTSHLTCSHHVLLALLAVCFTFSCDRERHGVVPAAAIAPIQEARGPSPLMSASASTSLAAVEVNQLQDRLGRAGAVIGSITQSASPSGSSDPSFRTDLGKALQDARVQGRGVLLVFSAAWNMPSTQMDKETFRNTDVQSQIDARFIAVRVDVTDDEGPGVQKALLSYAVVGLPTLILLDASGKEVKRLTELTDAAGLLKSLAAVPTNVVSTRAAGR